ncbi:MAG: hypothetical protein ACLTK0_03265 [Anaerovoracaceae bacterium]
MDAFADLITKTGHNKAIIAIGKRDTDINSMTPIDEKMISWEAQTI